MRYRNVFMRIGSPLVTTIAMVALMAGYCATAYAVIEDASFDMYLSELESMLPEGGPSITASSADLVILRSKPYVEVANNALSDAPIVELRMTIGDEAFHFGECSGPMCAGFVKIGSNSDVPLSLIDSSVEDGGNLLVVKFLGDGLQPNKFVHFKIDIDADAAPNPQHADYRTVLFDMDGHQMYGTSPEGMSELDNAEVTVKYLMAGMPEFNLGPIAFEDPEMSVGADYVNGRRLARGSERAVLDPSQTFQLPTPQQAIPEPGSILLIVAGLLSVAAFRRSRMLR